MHAGCVDLLPVSFRFVPFPFPIPAFVTCPLFLQRISFAKFWPVVASLKVAIPRVGVAQTFSDARFALILGLCPPLSKHPGSTPA